MRVCASSAIPATTPTTTRSRTGGAFVDSLDNDDQPLIHELAFEGGNPGRGVVVSTGYGDGSYPVEVRIEGGRVMELRVRFDDPDEDRDEAW